MPKWCNGSHASLKNLCLKGRVGSSPTFGTMVHTMEQLKDYVQLMLGAPVIAVDLSDEELDFCVNTPVKMLNQFSGFLKAEVLTRLAQEGASALGRYIVAKRKFNRLKDSYLFTPDEDGFAEMTQADSDWNEFVGEVKYYRHALRRNNDEPHSGSSS